MESKGYINGIYRVKSGKCNLVGFLVEIDLNYI